MPRPPITAFFFIAVKRFPTTVKNHSEGRLGYECIAVYDISIIIYYTLN